METIGLEYNEMVSLLASSWDALRKDIEPGIQLSIKQKIEGGYSKEKAELQSEIFAQLSSANSAILAVITENNKRILTDLREAVAIGRL